MKSEDQKSSHAYTPSHHTHTDTDTAALVSHRASTKTTRNGNSATTMRANGSSDTANETPNGAADELESLQVDNTSDVDSDNDSAMYDPTLNTPANHHRADEPEQQDPASVYAAQFGQIGYDALKFIAKFVDRVCMEGGLSDQQRLALHANLVDVISMQIQTLETVHAESRRVPARSKPKLENLKPDFMLNGERCVEPTPLRCYLMPDGREEVCGLNSAGHVLLPAEGALYLTNYRLIFRGVPLNDPLMNDAIVTRSFPVAALIKEKKLGNNSHAQKLVAGSLATAEPSSSSSSSSTTQLHDGLQMRSSTFQLIKVYFDDEVSCEQVDKFRASLARLRYPNTVMEFFCFGWRAAITPDLKRENLNNGNGLPVELYLNGGQQMGKAQLYISILSQITFFKILMPPNILV